MIKKGEIEKNLIRLYYLALSNCPVNWLEGSFQYRFEDFKKLSCIDNIFEVLDEERFKILKKANVSIYSYIVEKPFSPFPNVKDENFSQPKVAELLTEIFLKLKTNYEQKQQDAVNFLNYLYIPENGVIPFDDLKQSNIFRALFFRNDPLDSRKGTNSLIMLLILWSIKNGYISGKGVENLERIVNTFLCFSKKILRIDLNEAWSLLNKALGTNHKYNFDCKQFSV